MMDIKGPVHLVGIGGMHMSAIAQILLSRGAAVTGSDLRRSPLTAKVEALGARVFEGHAAEHVGDARLVVTTAAADRDNPELAEARRRGLPVLQRAEMVARLMDGKRVIAVAGSHGKTTTSSLIAYILQSAGQRPMYLLGGESIDLGGNAGWGDGPACVVEADEYKRAFHEYRPEVAVITNIEADHLDYFGTAEAYFEAFAEFARLVQSGGRLIVGIDDPGSRRLAEGNGRGAMLETFALEREADWRATDIQYGEQAVTFSVQHGGAGLGTLRAGVPGRHFVDKVLAASAVALAEDVSFECVREAVAAFRGARRRFEMVGEAAGVTVMDDYAHHPSEARMTIEAARRRFVGRHLVGVYQPHTYSRTAYLWEEWTKCWEGLDALVVLETYAAREEPAAGKGAAELAAAIERPRAEYARDFDEAARKAISLAGPGDVIITIGAGDVDAVGPRVLELLR